MIQPRTGQHVIPDPQPDVLVVGAGIFGLWAARRAILAGKRVRVLEKRRVGAGASGGFLGALMPHMPDRWNAKKQFQFEALSSLEGAVQALEADTGLVCHYRRCGRLMPVRSEFSLAEMDARIAGAAERWQGRYKMARLADPSQARVPGDWFAPDKAPLGLQYDDFSARIDPRAYVGALAAFVRSRGRLDEGHEVAALDVAAGTVVLADGTRLSAGQVVVANGWEAYNLLQPWIGDINEGRPIGRGVKGQGVLVEFAHGDDLPIAYSDGVYVVPHAGNRVAIGATADDDWQNGAHAAPDAFDPGNMEFYRRALELVPALKGAPIVERWANVRPRNTLKGQGTAPFRGAVPGSDKVFALIGGYRIGLAIAHVGVEGLG